MPDYLKNTTSKQVKLSPITLKMTKIYLSHRGNWHQSFIENTMEAFHETSVNLGRKLHGFECDFQQISMNNPSSWVIFHDLKPNALVSFSDIKGHQPLIKNNRTSKIPTLTDFVKFAQNIKLPIIINIEFKNGTIDAISHAIDILDGLNKSIHWIYSSFNSEITLFLAKKTTQSMGILVRKLSEIDYFLSQIICVDRIQFLALSYDLFIEHQRLKRRIPLPLGVYFKSMAQFKTNIQKIEQSDPVQVIFIEA
jgi:glycerophosphoryl diester phosphodiesterase